MTDRFCAKQRALFSDRLDGQKLPFWRGLLVRFHLTICPPCRRVNRSLVTTREALKELRDRDPL
jgi:predicted anti-sigma-YlaC factor YlaD